MREVLATPLNADELLDVTPPWSHILVAKRPVDAVSLPRICLEVEIAPAIDAATPHDRASSNLPPAYPVKRLAIGKRVWVLEVIHKKLGRPLVACACVPLDRLIALDTFPVT